MTTVTHEARVEDLPQAWRKDFDPGTRVRVTLSESTDGRSFWDAAQEVAGLWEDRSDAEIDALREDMRRGRRARFEDIIPKE